MGRGVGAAARLPEGDRKDLAVQALAGSETVTSLAARHGVSRKFVYQQTHKASTALDDAFASDTPDDKEALFELAVTKAWLRQLIVGLVLIGRSSYRGVVEFVRDLLGMAISVGCVHDVLQAAARQASAINQGQDLSGIRVGLHDELFQGATPVLAGVDAGQGLRAGQKAAWGETPPCHGDVFHIHHRCAGLADILRRLAQGATSRRKAVQAAIARAGQCAPDRELAVQLHRAREAETQAHRLAGDVRTLVHWLRHDVLALAGPDLATRRELFDFLAAELAAREHEDPRRIRPVRVALQNQRDQLLAFVGQLDAKLAGSRTPTSPPSPWCGNGPGHDGWPRQRPPGDQDRAGSRRPSPDQPLFE